MDYIIREMKAEEYPHLRGFLYEAIFQREGEAAPPKNIVEEPALQQYIKDFGMRKDDICLCADAAGKLVGAVWARDIDGYGNTGRGIPELALSLYPQYRGQGIGTQLLRQMLCLLRDKEYRKVSLAVQKDNYALRMYQKAGFQIVSENSEEYIMEYRFL